MTVRAMKAGAVEFLTKPVKSRDLLAAIRGAIERGRVSHQARREVEALRERYERLTPREQEVLPLVVGGLLNKQIAGELATSERTVKFHRAHIMRKMQAESLAELVRMAARLGLAPQSRREPVHPDSRTLHQESAGRPVPRTPTLARMAKAHSETTPATASERRSRFRSSRSSTTMLPCASRRTG